MIDFDIFDEFDNAIQKVDREIINLKLKQKKNERELLNPSRSPNQGFSDGVDKRKAGSFVVTEKHRKFEKRRRTMRKIRSLSEKTKWEKEDNSKKQRELMNIEEEICVFKIKKLLSSAPPGISDDRCWLRLISAFPLQRNLLQGLVLPADLANIKSLKPPSHLPDAVYRCDMNTWHVLPGVADFSRIERKQLSSDSALDLSFCESSFCETSSNDSFETESVSSLHSSKSTSPVKTGFRKFITGRLAHRTSLFNRDREMRSKSEGDTLCDSQKKLQKPLAQKPRMVISRPEIVNLPENISRMRLKSITKS
ncbi:unnamed protein product [Oikopleura dioica]|uniref:Uncharacterized protein n=1 Tax=Oikopleura dioica TaxID=34765 RepID=E4YA09_OIKDI|nr:unnamed protein product [Oikopleura dioica]